MLMQKSGSRPTEEEDPPHSERGNRLRSFHDVFVVMIKCSFRVRVCHHVQSRQETAFGVAFAAPDGLRFFPKTAHFEKVRASAM